MATLKCIAKGNDYAFESAYQSGIYNSQGLDGMTWTGSMYELGKQISMDWNDWNYGFDYHDIMLRNPKVKFDYGSFCGHPEFEYIFIPDQQYNTNILKYSVFALTNNKTILQYVGYLQFKNDIDVNSSSNSTNRVIAENEPNENYNPNNE